MGKRSEVIFGNRMSGQVVKKAENSKERFVRRFGDDSEVDYPLAVVKNPYCLLYTSPSPRDRG